MKTTRFWTALALTTGLSGLTMGCLAPPAGGGAKTGAAAFKDCGPEAMIDDGEDGNNQNLPVAGRGGYWYTFVDKAGSTVEPAAGDEGGTFAMTEGGANGSKYAACWRGKIGTASIVFGAVGMNFVDPKEAYDASKYAGIAFYAKRSADSTGKVRLKVPDVNTDPQGGVCSECFNDFGSDLNFSDQWTKYIIPFKKMSQMPGWGAPTKAHVVPSKIYGIQFQVNQPGARYDMCIDDLQFICES